MQGKISKKETLIQKNINHYQINKNFILASQENLNDMEIKSLFHTNNPFSQIETEKLFGLNFIFFDKMKKNKRQY